MKPIMKITKTNLTVQSFNFKRFSLVFKIMSIFLRFTYFISLWFYLSTTAQTGVPDFEVDQQIGCKPLVINITNKSTAINIFYIYGDGNSGLQLKHTYTRAGIYDLIQVVSGASAISLFDTTKIRVFDPQPLELKKVTCDSKKLNLELLPQNYYTAFRVDYGDGVVDTVLRTNILKHDYPDFNAYTLRIEAGFEDRGKLNLVNCATFQTQVRSVSSLKEPKIEDLKILADRTLDISYQVSPDYQSVLIHNGRVLKLDSSKSRAKLSCLGLENLNSFQIQTRLNADLKNLGSRGVICSQGQKLESNISTLPALELPKQALLYINVVNEELIAEARQPPFFSIQKTLLFKNGQLITSQLPNPIPETKPSNQSDEYRVAYLNKCTGDTLWSNKASNIVLKGSLVTDSNYIKLNWTSNKSFPDLIYSIWDLENNSVLTTVADSISDLISFLQRNLDGSRPKFSYQIEAFSPKYNIRFRSNISVLFRVLQLEIPDAFTPNGDGINDIFRILNPNLASLQMDIFNIWGNKIFTADQSGWNGKLNGEVAAAGVYYYVLRAEDLRGQIVHKKGSFLLIR